MNNDAARALYAGAGFDEVAYRAAQPQPARLRGPGQAGRPMTARSASTTCST